VRATLVLGVLCVDGPAHGFAGCVLALGQGLTHPNPQQVGFLVTLAVYSAWSAGLLAWVYLRPATEELALAAALGDAIAALFVAVLVLLAAAVPGGSVPSQVKAEPCRCSEPSSSSCASRKRRRCSTICSTTGRSSATARLASSRVK
jgi:hypothetical protein